MGNPLNFSTELPQRCVQLIDGLWKAAEQCFQVDRPDLGPLTTTFLIAMSAPMISLPIERIARQEQFPGYADDQHVDLAAAGAIKKILGSEVLGRAPFYISDCWSFVTFEQEPLFNVSEGLPEAVASALDGRASFDRASNLPVAQWSSILRNALAHGGIAYLNSQGRTSYGEPVKMYLFVSGKFDEDSKKLVGLYLLRISEENYRKFLSLWATWLGSIGA